MVLVLPQVLEFEGQKALREPPFTVFGGLYELTGGGLGKKLLFEQITRVSTNPFARDSDPFPPKIHFLSLYCLLAKPVRI